MRLVRERETRETSAYARTHARKSSKGFRSVAAALVVSSLTPRASFIPFGYFFLILLLSNSSPREQVVSLSLSALKKAKPEKRHKRLELVVGNNNTHCKRRVLIVVIFQGQFSNHGCCCCCFSSFGWRDCSQSPSAGEECKSSLYFHFFL